MKLYNLMRKIMILSILTGLFLILTSYSLAATETSCQTTEQIEVVTGDLVKTSDSPTIYYISRDNKRYVFSSIIVFDSWYSRTVFNDQIKTLTVERIANYQLGGSIPYAADRLVKITTDLKVYMTDECGVLHWITSEEVAQKIRGSYWYRLVHDITDSEFTKYTIGSDINSADDYSKKEYLRVCNRQEIDDYGLCTK